MPADLGEMALTDKWVLLFLIVAAVMIEFGMRLRRSLDLWQRWKSALAALPGMEKDAKRGVWLAIKLGAVCLLVLWAAARINTYR